MCCARVHAFLFLPLLASSIALVKALIAPFFLLHSFFWLETFLFALRYERPLKKDRWHWPSRRSRYLTLLKVTRTFWSLVSLASQSLDALRALSRFCLALVTSDTPFLQQCWPRGRPSTIFWAAEQESVTSSMASSATF